MKLSRLAVSADAASRLSRDELNFFGLIGQFSNDVTILHKLVTCTFREPEDELEHAANGVMVSVLLKALASKLWQGWKMVRQEVANGCLGKSAWLKQDAPLQEAVAKLCDYYGTANVIKTIRNKFGAHYDPAKSKRQFTGLSTADGFEVLYSDRLINAFYVTSEVAVWSTILDTTDEPEFRRRMKKLVEQVAARSQEFLQLLNLVSRAFINHSVQDLGGTFLPVAESNVDAVSPEDARLPLFIT